MRTRPALLDFLIIAVVAAIALCLIFLPLLSKKGELLTVSVRDAQGTRTVHECSLFENTSFTVENNGIKLTVTVSGGEVFVSEAGCDDRVCANSGKISRSGQSKIGRAHV